MKGEDQAETTSCALSGLKRSASDPKDTETNANKKQEVQSSSQAANLQQVQTPTDSNGLVIIDVTDAVKIQPGDRVEVQWDLHFGIDGSENSSKHTRWWGGCLLQPDLRTHTLQDGLDTVKVPIRVIDYDPFAEAGFLERSLEDVCFLSDHSLLNLATDSRAYWRKEGDNWEPKQDMDEEERKIMASCSLDDVASGAAATGDQSDDDISVTSTSQEDALRVVMDTVLKSAMQKSGVMGKMSKLEASQQSFMAEKIAKAKAMLTEKLIEQLKDTVQNDSSDNTDGDKGGKEMIVTKEHVTRCMEEIGKDL